jgi:hypothetical protein
MLKAHRCLQMPPPTPTHVVEQLLTLAVTEPTCRSSPPVLRCCRAPNSRERVLGAYLLPGREKDHTIGVVEPVQHGGEHWLELG